MDARLQVVVGSVVKAVDAAQLSDEDARRLLGEMLMDAFGAGVAREGQPGWRKRLRDLAVPEDVLDAAYAVLHRREPTGHPLAAVARVPDEVGAVVAHIRAVLGEPALWDPAPGYASSALSVIDSVWSIGVRYQGVLNVLGRYRALRAARGADAERDTPADLVRAIGELGGPEAFADAVHNRQRTSSRGGILKAEAVLRQARMLAEEGIASPDDLLEADAQKLDVVRRRWTSVPGQGSGLSLDYFLMLNGMPGVKADRMVRRFVANSLALPNELAISAEDAGALVRAAAHDLGEDDRVLDYAIWRYESGQ